MQHKNVIRPHGNINIQYYRTSITCRCRYPFLIQLLYYFCLYNRIHTRSRAVKRSDIHFSQELPPLSVIIYAREEVENLRRNLPAVLEQDYPQFEVIVINDGNTDESEDYLTLQGEKYPNLYHSFVPSSSRYISRKKLAITLGIKASKYDWLVFTDANCLPESNQWLRTMARNFTSRAQIVLGYSGYERGKGWLHKRVSFDNLFTSMRYLAMHWQESLIWVSDATWHTGKSYSMPKRFSAHLNLQREMTIIHQQDSYSRKYEDRDRCQRSGTRTTRLPRQRLAGRENQLYEYSTFLPGYPTLFIGL